MTDKEWAKWLGIGTVIVLIAVLVAAQIHNDGRLALACIEAGMEFVNDNCVSP